MVLVMVAKTMESTMETIESIESTNLLPAAKSFLILLALCNYDIYDSWSELIFSKGFRWVRECADESYYDHLFESLEVGEKIALVRKTLIRDLDINSSEDMAQVREMRQMEDQDETENA